jgi:hypothetical protein
MSLDASAPHRMMCGTSERNCGKFQAATRPVFPIAAGPATPEAVSAFRFFPPCSLVPVKAVPVGDGWLQVKFDGYRVQAH